MYLLLLGFVLVGCVNSQEHVKSEEELFSSQVLGEDVEAAPEKVSEKDMKLFYVCNNAVKSSYRKGHIRPEFAPNYVIQVFGSHTEAPLRAIFIEQGMIEKVLGEYQRSHLSQSGDLLVADFTSIVDDAKITLSIKGDSGVAETALHDTDATNKKTIRLSCSEVIPVSKSKE